MNNSSIPILCDNQATLGRAYNEVYNSKSRHVSLRHDYVRKLIKDEIISLVYMKLNDNLADPLTKMFTRESMRTTSRIWLKLRN